MKQFHLALLPIAALLCANAPAADLEISIEKLRNTRGTLHLCLTRNPDYFPDCGDDPQAVKRSLAAAMQGPVRLAGIAPGGYALSIIHDENDNGKLDTFLAIPREGFGFSRNPTIRFGPPSFRQVRFDLGAGIARQTIRMQYLL